MMVEILKFTREDVDKFDHKSIRHKLALNECTILSENVWKGVVDDEIVCVWGIVTPTIISDQCYLWLLTTDAAMKHKFIVVRWSQIVVELLLNKYNRIVGHVESNKPHSQKWLKWLGAEFQMPDEDGRKIPFVIRRKANG